MEEGGAVAGSDLEHRWLVDPLDGTTNFLHGIPHFAISLALGSAGELGRRRGLRSRQGRDVLGREGRSAPISTIAASAFPPGATWRTPSSPPASPRHRRSADRAAFIAQFDAASCRHGRRAPVRRAALDLAYVAAGRYEGFWESRLSPWDIAAGIVLVREAGGYVSEIDGGADMLATGSTFAANAHLHEAVGKLLRTATAANLPVRDKRAG